MSKPMVAADLAQALRRQGLTESAGEWMVLVADDDPETLAMHARMVQARLPGCRIVEARNGREALDAIRRERPDLVLLDLMMPELDGFGVLEAMRESEDTRDVPVIVLTAQVFTEDDVRRLDRGVAAVLGKGLYSADETLVHVERALAHGPALGNEMQQAVRRAVAYVHENYSDAISRADVARHTGVSESYLSTCFRQEMGIPFTTYLNRTRVERAKALLCGGKGVTEAALAVGFSDPSYFSRVFRREVGVSPSAYARGERER